MKTIPFDINKAKAGAKVVTRNSRPVRILCYDADLPHKNIVGITDNVVLSWTNEGKAISNSPIPYSSREYKVIQSEIVPFDLIEKENKLLVLIDKESLYRVDSYEVVSKLLNNSCTAYFQTWERKYGFIWQQKRVRFFDSVGNLVLDIAK